MVDRLVCFHILHYRQKFFRKDAACLYLRLFHSSDENTNTAASTPLDAFGASIYTGILCPKPISRNTPSQPRRQPQKPGLMFPAAKPEFFFFGVWSNFNKLKTPDQ